MMKRHNPRWRIGHLVFRKISASYWPFDQPALTWIGMLICWCRTHSCLGVATKSKMAASTILNWRDTCLGVATKSKMAAATIVKSISFLNNSTNLHLIWLLSRHCWTIHFRRSCIRSNHWCEWQLVIIDSKLTYRKNGLVNKIWSKKD